MPLFVPQTKLDADAKKLRQLEASVAGLTNSKVAFLARLTAGPESFSILGPVSDVVRDGVATHFTVGGDIMAVTIDAMGDRVILSPIKRQGEPGIPASAVIELKNDTPEVDFDAASAKLVYDTYELLDKGPTPSGSELAAGLNRHVAG